MNRFALVTRNVFVMFIGTVVNKLSGAFVIIVLARYVGKAGVGIYAFANSFTAIFSVIPDLGLNAFAIRAVAGDRPALKKYLGNIVGLRALLALVALLMTGAGIYLSGAELSGEAAAVVWFVAGAVFFTSIGSGFRWAFQAVEKLQYESLLTGGESLLLMIGWTLLLVQGYGLLEVTMVRMALAVATFGAGALLVFLRVSSFTPEMDRTFLRRLLVSAGPFIGVLIFSRIYFNLDTVLLKFISGNEETGRYNVAYRFITMLQMVPTLFQFAVFPALINASTGAREEFIRVVQRAYRYMIIAALGIGLITTVFAAPIIRLLYGGDFDGAVFPLQILVWMLFFSYITNVSNAVAIAHHREKIIMNISGMSLIINVVVNAWLIPRWGAVGAAVAIFVSEAFVFAALLYYIYRVMPDIRLPGLFVRPALAAAIAAAPGYLIRDINLFLGGACAAAVFFTVLLATDAIPAEDRRLALDSIKQR